MSYYPVTLQRKDPGTEQWYDVQRLHAVQVNKTSGNETSAAGAEQYHKRLSFVFRWCRSLQDVSYSPQLYRLQYQGHSFNIVDYDDYMERHLDVVLVGVSYG